MAEVLDKILKNKRKELEERKALTSVRKLELSPYYQRERLSLKTALTVTGSSGIIAEFKRKSPSAGWLFPNADPVSVCTAYASAGAAGLSVLTDREFFGGTRDDLMRAREVNTIPILRKDFLIDPYQVVEARAIGADVILLIAAALGNSLCLELGRIAHELGLEVLLEIHKKSELSFINEHVDLVGVNNRDLKKMKTDVSISESLAGKIPGEFVKISESGISDPDVVRKLKKAGYRGFLVGEYFMAKKDPGNACRKFISKIS